jgi:hypothetical protein
MNNPNVQLEDLKYMSIDELKQLSTEQVEELKRQYRILKVQQTLGTLSQEQLIFLGFDPNNLSDVSEYSMNLNLINSPQVIKCSRYSTQSPNGVMLYNKNSGSALGETINVTSKNGRTENQYWFANELLQSSNGLYSMQIQSDGNVVILDNNMTYVWSLKETYGTFFPIQSFEVRNITETNLYIVEIDVNDNPFANTTLNPYVKNRTDATLKKYNVYGVRVNDVGDFIFEAILIEEYADQTKDTYIIPYFIIRNSRKVKGPYEFLLNNNRVFEIRNTLKESVYVTNTESYGILRQIPDEFYETLDINPDNLTTANCKSGTVLKSEVASLRFNVDDFENKDIVYDPITKEYFRMYNYKLGLMSEDILKTWYYPKINTKAVFSDYYTHTLPYEIVFDNYQVASNNFTVSFVFEKKEDVILQLSETFVVSMISNKIYLNNVEVAEVKSNETQIHFVWIQKELKNTVYINGVVKKEMNVTESIDVIFMKLQTFTKTSSIRMYPSSLSNEEVESLYKDDVYSPGMKIKVKETYLFKKGNPYTPNFISTVTKDTVVFFENDDSIFFKYNQNELRFTRYIYNEFADRNSTNVPVAVPYDLSVISPGDLIYDPIYLKYYRFYNNSLGELPTSDILMSWYDVEITSPLIFYKPNKIQKELTVPEIQFGSNGFTISFFMKTKMKSQKLFDFGEDVRAEIFDDVFYVNDVEINKRISNNVNNHIVIEYFESGSIEVFVNTKRVNQINGKSYPLNIKRKSSKLSVGLTDFRIYQNVLLTEDIDYLYKQTIYSPEFPRLYTLDTRKLPKGNTYEYLEKDNNVSESVKIVSIDEVNAETTCAEHCKSLDCKKYEVVENRCDLYNSSEIRKPQKLKYIYIENDKSKTYDIQTKKQTQTIIASATPLPFNKFSITPSTSLKNNQVESPELKRNPKCPISYWKVLIVTIVVLLFFYLIKIVLKSDNFL